MQRLQPNGYDFFTTVTVVFRVIGRVFQVDGNSSTLSMCVHFKQLKRLVEESTFSQILIPLQSVLIPTLPYTGGANTQHDAFPGHWAYLAAFEDTVRDGSEGVFHRGDFLLLSPAPLLAGKV